MRALMLASHDYKGFHVLAAHWIKDFFKTVRAALPVGPDHRYRTGVFIRGRDAFRQQFGDRVRISSVLKGQHRA